MQHIIDQVLDHVRGAWRYRWAGFGVAAALSLLGWAVVLATPNIYQASARVFVDTSTMLSQVTQGLTIESNVETQINRMRQAMLSAPQLLKVAEETGLSRLDDSPRDKQDLVQSLVADIVVKGVPVGGSGSIYTIEYRHHDRELSERVVDKLLKAFEAGAMGGNQMGSEKAQEFLTDKIADYEKRLADAEGRLAAFKKQNVGLMPGAQGDYFMRLQTEMQEAQKAEADLSLALKRKAALQRQLQGGQPFIEQAGTADGAGAVLAPPPLVPTATDLRLREAQARLDDLLLKFTDRHPNVTGLRDTIKDLEQRRAQEIVEAQRGGGATASTRLGANPVYQQVQSAANQNDVDIATLQTDLANRQQKVASLRALVDTAPNVEARFAQLNRDYEVTKSQYVGMLQRLDRTRLGEEAQAEGAVQFDIIDPPNAGLDPVAPNRPVLITLILIVSLGAGGGLAYLLNLLKPVFYNPGSLAQASGLPVLGVISCTWFDRRRSEFRRGVIGFAFALSGLTIVAAAAIVFNARLAVLASGLMA